MEDNYRAVTPESIKLREEDGRHYVTARVCSYNVPDSWNTSWAPGCFNEGLKRRLPSMCFAHDDKRVIGKVVSYNDTPDGLDIEARFSDFESNTDAKRMWNHLREEEVNDWSFWFKDEKGSPDLTHNGVTRFTSARLLEVSPVLAASVPGTKTLSIRSEEERTMDTSNMKPFVKVVQPNGVVLNKVPHKYSPVDGKDGALCQKCMKPEDNKVHQVKGLSPEKLRDLAVTLASEPLENPGDNPAALVATADYALDMALGLASYQRSEDMPAWLVQLIALVMTADSHLDEAMTLMGVPWEAEGASGEIVPDTLRSIDLSYVPEPKPPTPADLDLMLRLKKLSR